MNPFKRWMRRKVRATVDNFKPDPERLANYCTCGRLYKPYKCVLGTVVVGIDQSGMHREAFEAVADKGNNVCPQCAKTLVRAMLRCRMDDAARHAGLPETILVEAEEVKPKRRRHQQLNEVTIR